MKPEHLELQSADGCQFNLDALYQIAPSCFTEAKGPDGKVRRMVNFDILRQLLGDAAADSVNNWGDEFYQFTWPGKAEARREAARPIKKTLRPVKDDSVDWDTTQNLYIEGDNLEVLKLLQKSYLGKVKMIYIDPPYNTGNDFVYNDDFAASAADNDFAEGNTDELGNRYRKNTDSNGRFHSDWCSMIYPRLQLARNLLSEDGVIFISLDDNEIENLTKICNEVFGSTNKVGLMTLLSNPRGSQNGKNLSHVHEYILMFAKNIQTLEIRGISKEEDSLAEFKEIDECGRKYRLLGLRKRGGAWRKEDRPNMFYPIFVNPLNGECSAIKSAEFCIKVIPQKPTGELSRWTWGPEKFANEKHLLVGKRVNRTGQDDAWDIFRRDYIDNEDGEEKTTKVKTIWDEKETNYQNAKNEIKALFGNSEIFDFPKPTYIVRKLASMLFAEENDICLDFFSGSSTTADAIMQLNAADNGSRRFIMIQLEEVTPDGSQAKQAGYKTIPEIAKERIRRAGRKVKEEAGLNGQDLDIGFRVFRVDESNMEDVYFAPKSYSQDKLDMFLDNVKADRTDLDLLFGAMLDWGVQLSLPMSTETVDGRKVYVVNEGDLVACFAEDITEEVIEFIADQSPLRVLLRDSCFSSDADKINIFEQFKQRLGWSDEEAYKNIRVI